MIDLCGYSGIALEAVAENFGERSYRGTRRSSLEPAASIENFEPATNPGIGKLKVGARTMYLAMQMIVLIAYLVSGNISSIHIIDVYPKQTCTIFLTSSICLNIQCLSTKKVYKMEIATWR